MYRTTGAGKDALPPAMMAMAMLVQGYLGISDAEMVELTVVDLRVQMVLGCLGAVTLAHRYEPEIIAPTPSPRSTTARSSSPRAWRGRRTRIRLCRREDGTA